MKPATAQEFIEKAQKTHGDRYTYINVVYVNSRTKVKICCPEHGDFEQFPSAHIRGNGCPLCKTEQQKSTTSDFIIKAKGIHGNIYGYSNTKYNGNKSKIIINCELHGDFMQRCDAHLQGQGCFKCEMDKRRLGKSAFIEKSCKIHGERYDYGGVIYVNSKSKVMILCKEHGEFNQSPYSHLSGSGCPKCKQSKGERKIYKMLTDKNVNFKSQYRFNDCRGKRHPLPFDFAIMDDSGIISFLIEYDGEQHFTKMRYDCDNDKRLIELKRRDDIKTKYCVENNIPLLRIPYTHYNNIEQVSNDFMREVYKVNGGGRGVNEI